MAETRAREAHAIIERLAREAEADARHDARAASAGIRGVGIVTRGMAVPVKASVVRAPVGQWQAMPADVPVSLSEARAATYRRDRDRERAATQVSNTLLARDRAADNVKRVADAMREQSNPNR